MKYTIERLLLCVTAALFWVSCSTTRYVPDGEYLLNSVKVKAEVLQGDSATSSPRHRITQNLRNYVRQNPNSSWFSVFKLPLATYSLSGRDTTRWLNRTLRNIGEPPVIFDSLKAALSLADLRQQLRNEGFLNADVRLELRRHRKKIDVVYWLKPYEPYFIHTLNYQIEDSLVNRLLADDAPRRLLSEGMRFDISRLDDERKRITKLLTSNGYFRFHKEYITYLADSLAGSKLIGLTLRLAPPSTQMAASLHPVYRLRNIRYASGDPQDERLHLRSRVLEECTHLYEGQLYSSAGLQDTYNHFGRLQAVKYTNILFHPVENDSALAPTTPPYRSTATYKSSQTSLRHSASSPRAPIRRATLVLQPHSPTRTVTSSEAARF